MFDHLLHQFSNSGLGLSQIFAWVGLLAVAFLVWQSWRGGHDFQIILRRGIYEQATVKGRAGTFGGNVSKHLFGIVRPARGASLWRTI